MDQNDIYEKPKYVSDINDCFFYHTINLPGHGEVKGIYDFRKSAGYYLGNVDFNGKRVLEFGPASGFLSFEMEKQGARVVSFDVAENVGWDIVPFSKMNVPEVQKNMMVHINQVKNAYWFCHRLLNSEAKIVYGSVYNVPREIGEVDIVTFGAILLHLRDPFLALQNGACHARKTIIVTDVFYKKLFGNKSPSMRFLPHPDNQKQFYTWWELPPQTVTRMLSILGFDDVTVIFHKQVLSQGGGTKDYSMPLYTIVGHRTDCQDIFPYCKI